MDESPESATRGRVAWHLLPLVLLAGVTACEDDLSQPEIRQCEAFLEVSIVEVPVTVRYLADIGGSAILETLTYTTPDGDVDVTELENQCAAGGTQVDFCTDVPFEEAGVASIRAEGEAATGGQIGVGYNVLGDQDNDAFDVCTG